jgi:hypothetical protein
MARHRFQFRLWQIFAVTALIGWGIVAVPYWLTTYREEQQIQGRIDEDIRQMNLSTEVRARQRSEREMRREERRYEEMMGFAQRPPSKRRNDRGTKLVLFGTSLATVLAIGLSLYRRTRRPQPKEGS